MSERAPQDGRPASSAQADGYRIAQPPVTITSYNEALHRTASNNPPSLVPRRSSTTYNRGPQLPPLSGSVATAKGNISPVATRIAGVSSILNPLPDDESQTGQRRKASQLDSPGYFAQHLPPIASDARDQPLGLGPPPPAAASNQPRSPRRILAPISPSLHRTASLGQLSAPSASLSAQQTPFPPSPHGRVYTVEPGRSGAPPLPSAPATSRPSGYGYPVAPASEAARRASTGTTRTRNASPSASPTTSYSSYSKAGNTSPSNTYAPLSAYQGGASSAEGGQRSAGIPISSSGGPNVYQMMTLETTSGTVQLPVDVQAASRVADEKRRRNAGASARFRQRRKEKEKESSTTIGRLEQRLKDVSEDADFYRGERDYLRSVLRTVPGMERHLQRPPSPRHIRGSRGSLSGPMSRGSGSYMQLQEREPRSPDEGRNVRRRTSTYSLPPPSLQGPPPPGPPMQPGYQTSSYGAPLAPAGPLPSPLTRQPLPTQSQRPSSQQQHQPPQSGHPSGMQGHPQGGPYH